MNVIRNERIIPTDIDETLVMHDNPLSYNKYITVEDPHEAGKYINLGVNQAMVKILKDEKARGAYIIAWSRSGNAWAETIIKALDLTNFVDLILTKPLVYLDDKDASEWMRDRVYIGPNTVYKQHNS